LRAALADFTADLLAECGALVETKADALEVLLPPDVAHTLKIPEHANLVFSGEVREGMSVSHASETLNEGIFVSYDSEIFKSMAALMGEQGKFATIAFPAPVLRLEKLEDRLDEKVAFDNAIFHVARKEEKRISYLLGYFRYFALSDDRQEGLFACLMNEFNLAARKVTPEILDLLVDYGEEPTGGAARESGEKILKAFSRAQAKIAKEALLEFLSSVERRMNRDIRRVHDYYQTMAYEQRRLLEKKAGAAEEKEKILGKVDAIENELKRKVQDLIGKFSIDVSLEPITLIRIEATAPTFWLDVKRRKETRPFPLTFNPILKSFDPVPCEACFYPTKGRYVCDDHLHFLCRECFAPCPRCERIYCGACHPKGCPRCSFSVVKR
jgi:hypothetical protein